MQALKRKSILGTSLEDMMLDNVPVNVMLCNPHTFNIDYVNETTRATLNKIAHLLPPGVNGDTILGKNIDIFHRNPSHQRNMLSNPRNLPYKTVIRLGPEALELNVNALMKGDKVHKLMLTWMIVTERENLKKMTDLMPINVMMCDPKEFKINYLNETSKKTLKSIENLLPIKADQVLGACIDIFHKMPSHQRKILGDPKNLPYRSLISLGEEKLDLSVAAIVDEKGYYVGPMVSWSVATAQHRVAGIVGEVTKTVSATSAELQATAQTLAASAEETSRQSSSVAAAAEESSTNVQTVAAAAEELSNTINTVGDQVKRSAETAKKAVLEAKATDKTVQSLSEAASKIGAVVQLITDIAAQTNLLALNATIEAARAGEAGKGFAVVASEVKNLATQTAKATDEIAGQISAIQVETTNAVNSIRMITQTIEQMDEIAGNIMMSVSEQSAATTEIAKNVQQAAAGTSEVSQNISGIQQSATETGVSASQMLEAASELAKMASTLETEISSFIKK